MPPAATPSSSLLAQLRTELMAHAPFAQMAPADVDAFLAAAEQAYYAPDETVLAPGSGVATHLLLVRQGSVTGRRGPADAAGGFLCEAGELFPVGAVLGQRAVTTTYTAAEDTFCLRVPAAQVRALADRSAPFAAFLQRRVDQLLALSRQQLQAAWAAQALAEQSLETPLGQLARRAPVWVAPATPLAEALATMQARRIGSVLVADAAGVPLGILTRHDLLGRVTLAQRPLATPIAAVMSAPLHTLRSDHTAQDAALLMARHGIRHVPVTDAGRLVGIVSERDLFTLQRLSLRQVGSALRAAPDLAALCQGAADIRRLAQHLLAQGVGARQLTALISHLNDLLTERLVGLVAQRQGLDLRQACWLAFGSEGRGVQTIATDQDNGLVFASDDAARDRPRWLALAAEVNAGLDRCGYPLCAGQVMASNPACCLASGEWHDRFGHWMDQGAPDDLLKASIFFDLRPVAGNAALAAPLQALPARRAAALPRFLKQLALQALGHRPPLNWRGALETTTVAGRGGIDLKLQGTALFVDAARILALAQGVTATGTRARLEAAAPGLGVPAHEVQAWVAGFEFLQMLRLRLQLDPARPDGPANRVDVDGLHAIDRRMLKESLRVARSLQQRLALDHAR